MAPSKPLLRCGNISIIPRKQLISVIRGYIIVGWNLNGNTTRLLEEISRIKAVHSAEMVEDKPSYNVESNLLSEERAIAQQVMKVVAKYA